MQGSFFAFDHILHAEVGNKSTVRPVYKNTIRLSPNFWIDTPLQALPQLEPETKHCCIWDPSPVYSSCPPSSYQLSTAGWEKKKLDVAEAR